MLKKIDLSERQKHFLLILLFSLPVLFWAEPGRIIIGGDVTLPRLSSMLYAWFSSADAGSPFISFTWIIWNGFLEALSYISLDFAYRAYFFVLMFASGIGMHYFVSTITKKLGRVPLYAALLYMFNPFVFTSFTYLYVYAVIPPMIAFFVKGIKQLKLRYFLYFSVLAPILFLVFPNLTFPLITLMLMACLLPFYINMKEKRKVMKAMLLFPIIFLLINAWWLAPGLYNLMSFYNPLGEISEVTIPTFSFSLVSAFRWLGVWAFETFSTEGTFQGMMYYPFIEVIQTNPFLVALTFLPAIMAFSALYLSPRDRNVVIFASLTLAAIFFSKGPNEPFGSIYTWLMTNVPFFKFFRDTNRFMFMVTLSYSFLIAVAIRRFSSRLKGAAGTAFPLVVMALLLVNAWPLFTGDVAVNWYDPSHRGVSIPSFYYDADRWFSEQDEHYRIFVLPRPDSYIANKWGYQGANILHYTMSKPVIIGSTFGGSYISADSGNALSIPQLYEDFRANRISNFAEILGLLNVKYAVIDSSVDTEFYGMDPISRTTELLEQEDGMEKAAEIGELLVYSNSMFVPHLKHICHHLSSPFS